MADAFKNLPINALYPQQVKDSFLQSLQDYKNSNLASPAFLQGVNNIEFLSGQNGMGYVSPFDPATVNVFPYGQNTAQILAHEAAHTQAMLANKRRPTASEATVSQYNEANFKREEGFALQEQLIKNYKTYVKQYLSEKDTKNAEADLGGYFGDKAPQYDERIADLQSLEAKLPKGQTLLDTPLGKQILNTPELQNYWRQTVTPLDVKAIPNLSKYEKPFWIKSLEKLQNASNVFTQEVRGNKSYANSAIEALKTMSPFYQDPFKDTTK